MLFLKFSINFQRIDAKELMMCRYFYKVIIAISLLDNYLCLCYDGS